MIVTSSCDKSLIVWQLTKENKVYGLPHCGLTSCGLTGHSHFIEDVVLSSNHQFALSDSWDFELRLWDLSIGITAHRLSATPKMSSLSLSPSIIAKSFRLPKTVRSSCGFQGCVV
ncbi:hypothetical protein ACSBR1_003982 [Camellia fascicularis]